MVVEPPLWKIWKSFWMVIPIYGKIKVMFQSPPTSIYNIETDKQPLLTTKSVHRNTPFSWAMESPIEKHLRVGCPVDIGVLGWPEASRCRSDDMAPRPLWKANVEVVRPSNGPCQGSGFPYGCHSISFGSPEGIPGAGGRTAPWQGPCLRAGRGIWLFVMGLGYLATCSKYKSI